MRIGNDGCASFSRVTIGILLAVATRMFATMLALAPLLTGAVDPASEESAVSAAQSSADVETRSEVPAVDSTVAPVIDATLVSPKKEHPLANAIIGAALASVVTGVAASFLFKLELDRWWEQYIGKCRPSWAFISCESEKITANPLAVFGGIYGAGSLILTPLTAYLFHHFSGGKGTGKAAFLGATLGTLTGVTSFAGALLFAAMGDDPLATLGAVVFTGIGFAAPAIGTVIGLNYSHNSALVPQVSIVPTRSGGSLSLAWEL